MALDADFNDSIYHDSCLPNCCQQSPGIIYDHMLCDEKLSFQPKITESREFFHLAGNTVKSFGKDPVQSCEC